MKNLYLKKGISFLIILLFIFCFYPSTTGFNKNLQYNEGNTLYVGGSGEGNYTKIQDAIDNSSDGGTVFVYADSSPYYENILLNKSINLIGEDKNTTIIQSVKNTAIIKITIDGILLKNFTLNNDFIQNGVQLKSNSSNIISNDFKVNHIGIYLLEQSSNNIISQNNFFEGTAGIVLKQNCNNNIISNNTFIKNDLLIGFSDPPWEECSTKNNTIEYNNISPYSGVRMYDAKETTFSNNIIKFSEVGHGLSVIGSEHITISGNIIEFNYDGIYIHGSSNIVVKRNTIYSNGNKYSEGAIILISTHNGEIISNNISNNKGHSLSLFFLSQSKIYNNNFINNENDTYFINSFFNRFNGNYWSEPRRSPKVIFGKISIFNEHKWINFDWHPAKEPYDI